MEQRLAHLHDAPYQSSGCLALAHLDGILHQRDDEGLHAIAQVCHVARLRLEERSRDFLLAAIVCQEVAVLVLHALKIVLQCPKRIVGIKGYRLDIIYFFHSYHFFLLVHIDLLHLKTILLHLKTI